MILIHKETARTIKIHDSFYLSDRGDVYGKDLSVKKTYMRGKYKICYNPATQRSCFIHRLVAEMFVKNENPQDYIYVNHIDGDRFNNSFTNLEWCTAKMNTQNIKDRGRFINPPKRQYIKLKDERYFDLMIDYYFNGIKMNFLETKYGISRMNVRKNLDGKIRASFHSLFLLAVFGFNFFQTGKRG